MPDDANRPSRPLPHDRRRDRLPGGGGQHLDLDALGAWLDGDLDPADRRAAAAHLAACAACRGELAELRATVALLRGLPQYAPHRSFRLGPEHAGAAARAEGRLLRFLPALPALRAAALAVAVLLVAAVVGDVVSTARDDPAAERIASSGDGAFVQEAPADSEIAAGQPAAPAMVEIEAADAGGTEPAGAASNRVAAPADADAPDAPAAEVRQETGGDPASDAAVPDDAASDRAEGDDASAPETAPAADGGPSGWRLAGVGLALVLIPLVVAVVALERLSRRPPEPVASG